MFLLMTQSHRGFFHKVLPSFILTSSHPPISPFLSHDSYRSGRVKANACFLALTRSEEGAVCPLPHYRCCDLQGSEDAPPTQTAQPITPSWTPSSLSVASLGLELKNKVRLEHMLMMCLSHRHDAP